jgi:hypothetical protein
MPLQALAAAERGGYAVGAFNVSDLNQAIAVLTPCLDRGAADRTQRTSFRGRAQLSDCRRDERHDWDRPATDARVRLRRSDPAVIKPG